jgi:signal recognition particle receptor subunit beta
MAVIDSEAGEIVIRLVYDGPPEAGKTTSLRALSASLTRPTYSPAEDAAGRTLWFDWMEYVGGRFEGCQIRCQIVSVPGQRELDARRRRVIAGADVVVFVADSAVHETPRTLSYLLELREMLAGGDPPVGVILQANKRDLPAAIPLDELRAQLAVAGWPIGVVESVAADGTGIREAFVYAVRLALDRVRELLQRGAMPSVATGPRSADELYAALRADDLAQREVAAAVVEHSADSLAAALLREVLAFEDDSSPATADRRTIPGAPRPPNAAVPSGAIWPPVEGRAILCELAQIALTPRRLSTGDWAAGLGSGWRMVSSRDAAFASLDQGRTALIQWARLHASAIGAISPRRCIVLADDGCGEWRLWQLVRAESSLRDAVDLALRALTREAMVAGLRRVAQLLLDADARLGRMPLRLSCTLDSIGPSETGAVYIGLMPGAADAVAESRARRDPRSLLRSALEPVIAGELSQRGLDLNDIIGRLQHPEGIAHAVTTLLGA